MALCVASRYAIRFIFICVCNMWTCASASKRTSVIHLLFIRMRYIFRGQAILLYYSTEADKYSSNHGINIKTFQSIGFCLCSCITRIIMLFYLCCLSYSHYLLSFSLSIYLSPTHLWLPFHCLYMFNHARASYNERINSENKKIHRTVACLFEIYQTFLV